MKTKKIFQSFLVPIPTFFTTFALAYKTRGLAPRKKSKRVLGLNHVKNKRVLVLTT